MNATAVVYDRSVIRVPVAGPAPNNTLVFVRAWVPVRNDAGDIAPGKAASFVGVDDDLNSTAITFESLYVIDAYERTHPEWYANTQISISAFLSTVDLDRDDGAYVCAVDSVEGKIDALTGQLSVTASIAEQEDTDTELTLAVFVSAWILTREPQPDFLPAPGGARSLRDAVLSERGTARRWNAVK